MLQWCKNIFVRKPVPRSSNCQYQIDLENMLEEPIVIFITKRTNKLRLSQINPNSDTLNNHNHLHKLFCIAQDTHRRIIVPSKQGIRLTTNTKTMYLTICLKSFSYAHQYISQDEKWIVLCLNKPIKDGATYFIDEQYLVNCLTEIVELPN